jgi:nitrogenase molybdenum-iron protein alpha/beta subunit
LILGTSFQRRIAEELDAALIRVAYPAHDEFSLYDDAPYMGYRGMVVMVEKILNLFLNKYPKEER